MATAVGNMGGMPNSRLLSTGVISPTTSPVGPPKMNPQSRTGMCMGKRRAPKAGICAVKKGISRPKAKKKAAKTRCLVDSLAIRFSSRESFSV
jgi:hypothetical protein